MYEREEGNTVSGLLRNLIAFLIGLFFYERKAVQDVTEVRFLVTPLDTGIRRLKSDKYLQLAETAQVDYFLQTGRFFAVLKAGASFVNVGQLVRFARPVPVFSRVRVATRLIHADDKCAYFRHTLRCQGQLAAEVLVKMKFKQGRVTVPPRTFLPAEFNAAPAQVLALEAALGSGSHDMPVT